MTRQNTNNNNNNNTAPKNLNARKLASIKGGASYTWIPSSRYTSSYTGTGGNMDR